MTSRSSSEASISIKSLSQPQSFPKRTELHPIRLTETEEEGKKRREEEYRLAGFKPGREEGEGGIADDDGFQTPTGEMRFFDAADGDEEDLLDDEILRDEDDIEDDGGKGGEGGTSANMITLNPSSSRRELLKRYGLSEVEEWDELEEQYQGWTDDPVNGHRDSLDETSREEEEAEDEELLEDVERQEGMVGYPGSTEGGKKGKGKGKKGRRKYLRRKVYGGGKKNRKGGKRNGWEVALAVCTCV